MDKTRLIQLIARYVGVGLTALAAKLGMQADPSSLAEPIATAIVAVGCFVLDLILHKKQDA